MLPGAHAQSEYDWLAGSEWYVPAANVLAYLASPTDLSSNIPIGDQTLWNITTSENGVFSGMSVATLNIMGELSASQSLMNGVVTPDGQIRIIFTLVGSADTQTVGIGQFRNQGGIDFMEMQMITGNGSAYVTHWAYMAQVPDGTFVPPAPNPENNLLSQEWIWMNGTTWDLLSPDVFGTGPAQFTVESYVNGYFWGTGQSSAGSFSHIGSVTPEGNVLFNFLLDGNLSSLAGQISGDASNGQMLLRQYEGIDDFGAVATASVIPEPSAWMLLLMGSAAVIVFRYRQIFRKKPY